jgi:hypothetical protein
MRSPAADSRLNEHDQASTGRSDGYFVLSRLNVSAMRSLQFALRAAVVAAVAAGGIIVVSSHWTSTGPWTARDFDFLPDYLSAEEILAGGDPYAPLNSLVESQAGTAPSLSYFEGARNAHTPAQILVVAPLTRLPYATARNVWLILMACSVVIAGVLLGHELGWSPFVSFLAGGSSLLLLITGMDLRNGQINGLLLLLLVLSWWCMRHDRQRSGGIFLGLAIAIKVFPVLMLIPLARARRARMAIWAIAVGGAVSLFLFLWIGLDEAQRFIFDVTGENLQLWRSAPRNMSLVSLPAKWLIPSPWNAGALNMEWLATLLAALAFLACCAGAFLTQAGYSRARFWAAVPWAIMAAPIAWDHYLVLAIPLLMLMGEHFLQIRRMPPPTLLLGAFLTVAGSIGAVLLTEGLLGLLILRDPGAWTNIIAGVAPLIGVLMLALHDLPGTHERRPTYEAHASLSRLEDYKTVG